MEVFRATEIFSKKMKEGVDSCGSPARFINPGRYFGITAGVVLRRSASRTRTSAGVVGNLISFPRKSIGSPHLPLQPLASIFESAGPVSHKQWKPDGSYTKTARTELCVFRRFS